MDIKVVELTLTTLEVTDPGTIEVRFDPQGVPLWLEHHRNLLPDAFDRQGRKTVAPPCSP